MMPYTLDWFAWVPHVPAGLELLVLLAAAVAALFAINKAVIKPLRTAWKKWNAAVDSLVGGHDAVLDPDNPDNVLKPATKPLTQRVAGLEDAMNKLLDMQEKQLGINERLLSLEEWRKNHETWSEEIVQNLQTEMLTWQKEHEAMHLLSHETAQQIAKNDTPQDL